MVLAHAVCNDLLSYFQTFFRSLCQIVIHVRPMITARVDKNAVGSPVIVLKPYVPFVNAQ